MLFLFGVSGSSIILRPYKEKMIARPSGDLPEEPIKGLLLAEKVLWRV